MSRVQIPLEVLRTFEGRNLHVAKLKYGCVFKLITLTTDVQGEVWMHLETPSTRKPYKFKAKHAEYLRKDIPLQQGGMM